MTSKRNSIVIIIAIIEFLIIISGFFYLSAKYPVIFQKQKPAVLVIDIEGEIISTQFGGIFEKRGVGRKTGVASAKNIVRMLDFFSDDPNIKAFILSIDSTGGQSAGQEEIVRQIQRTGKPVVSVVHDSALSAAYYVAAGTDRIFASKQSNIADIGLVTMYVNRIRNETEQVCKISSTEYKRMYDSDCPGFEPEILEKLEHYLEVSHELLVYDIADMRGLSTSYVLKLSDGTIFKGAEALKLKLIDEIGDIENAKEWLEEELGMKLEILYLREMLPQ